MQQNSRVKVHGTTKPELNGQNGTVINYDPDKGRYTIHLDNGTRVALKPDNVQYLPRNDEAGGGSGGFPGMGGFGGIPGMNPEMMMQVQAMMQQLITIAQTILPGIPLQQVGYGVLIAFGILGWKIGMMKAILLFTMLGGVVFLFVPTYRAAGGRLAGAKAGFSHMGNLAASKIEASTGKRVPLLAVQALIVVGFVLVFCFAFSLTPMFAPSTYTGGAGGGDGGAYTGAGASGGSSSSRLEEMYAAGYADGQKNEPYGTSKPVFSSSSASSSTPGSSSSGIMGKISGMFSRVGFLDMILIGFWVKTVYELGRVGGSWNLQVAMDGVRNLPTSRLVMLGILVARLAGVF